ncbi:MAG: multidrug efflux SMR transporter, partial [Prosthecochloris sp.]|uniref:DMT family transporter n=1 Tax=Prosthecochloris sp. TaxID=290513 RepID=UPI002589C7A0
MVWVYLFVGGFFECVWAVSMKYSEGFTKLWPSIVTVLSMIASLWLLSLAMKSLPAGTAYAVWTGIGAVGVA